jgi:cobalt/nickel transport system permease protein
MRCDSATRNNIPDIQTTDYEKENTVISLADTDPRVRLTSALAFAFVMASLNSIAASATGLLFAVMYTLASGNPLIPLFKRLILVNTFVMFMWLMLPFSYSTPGEVVGILGPLEVTREGLILAVLLTLKANAILLAVMSLIAMGPIHIMAEAARSLGLPDKLVNLFQLSIRYFHVAFDEYHRLRIAMKARGFKSSISRHTLRSIGNLLGILLVRSFDRADRIYKAMLLRGYDGSLHVKNEFRLKKLDLLFALSIAIAIGTVIMTQWQLKI